MDDRQPGVSLRMGLSVTGLDLAELWQRCFAYGSTLSAATVAQLIDSPDPDGLASAYERSIVAVVINEALDDLGIPYLAEVPGLP